METFEVIVVVRLSKRLMKAYYYKLPSNIESEVVFEEIEPGFYRISMSPGVHFSRSYNYFRHKRLYDLWRRTSFDGRNLFSAGTERVRIDYVIPNVFLGSHCTWIAAGSVNNSANWHDFPFWDDLWVDGFHHDKYLNRVYGNWATIKVSPALYEAVTNSHSVVGRLVFSRMMRDDEEEHDI
jgi:hypothetical protein